MTRTAQRRATANHRKRARAKGLVRLELTVPKGDVAMLRQMAEKLRNKKAGQKGARGRLETGIQTREPKTVLEMFASDLPDEYFEGMFERKRTVSKREIDL